MNKKPPLLKSIKYFLIQQKIINIKINLFVFEIVIEILYQDDWFTIQLVLFKIIQFYATACYGAGWGITFYKTHISIHAKRVIIAFCWWNKNCFADIKLDWMMASMNYKQLTEVKRRIKKIENIIK